MSQQMGVLIVTAISIAFIHTLMGPDHYLPFIVLSRSRKWSLGRTLLWTILCGCGHVWSSVILGLGGAALGWSLSKVRGFENIRGGLAGWALLLFGLAYTLWGWHKAKKNRPHKHFDMYDDGSLYVYEHDHTNPVLPQDRHKVTPWVMFVIFAMGPSEPMIPLLYFPAAKNSWTGMLVLIAIYTLCTLMAMAGMVMTGYFGFNIIKTATLEKYVHFLGGLAIFFCGTGMVFMGW